MSGPDDLTAALEQANAARRAIAEEALVAAADGILAEPRDVLAIVDLGNGGAADLVADDGTVDEASVAATLRAVRRVHAGLRWRPASDQLREALAAGRRKVRPRTHSAAITDAAYERARIRHGLPPRSED